jgi:hypothetical protein
MALVLAAAACPWLAASASVLLGPHEAQPWAHFCSEPGHRHSYRGADRPPGRSATTQQITATHHHCLHNLFVVEMHNQLTAPTEVSQSAEIQIQ